MSTKEPIQSDADRKQELIKKNAEISEQIEKRKQELDRILLEKDYQIINAMESVDLLGQNATKMMLLDQETEVFEHRVKKIEEKAKNLPDMNVLIERMDNSLMTLTTSSAGRK
ncbi:hypothetical protein AAG570_000766 [Ranatra chinensis]|uniref:Uncharacterized protein n=1 Tax=Ranatra chinensis TaxID=642074 RepID=A0ABD0YY04_9HEMI